MNKNIGRSQDPKYWATVFINKFHTKRVGGSEMLQYLAKKFKQYGLAQYNKGYDDGRDEKARVYLKGFQEGVASVRSK